MTESNFETNTADEPQDSSITVSILGDDTGIIQNTLRAKGINTVHSVSNDTLNDVNASDHYRNLLKEQSPDAVIVAVVDETVVAAFAPILVANPNLSIIHADLNTNQIQVITNHSIDARMSDLLAAIAALPKQGASSDNETMTG